MTTYVSICAVIIVLAMGSLNAQERQIRQQDQPAGETLTKVEVPGADFDIVVATTKSQIGAIANSGKQLDPLEVGLWPTSVYLVPKGETVGAAKK